MKRNFYYCLLVIVFCLDIAGQIVFAQAALAQSTLAQSVSWSQNGQSPKAFIENKGQFGSSSSVLFAVDDHGTLISFTKTGVNYSFLERTPKPKEGESERKEHEVTFKKDQVSFKWEGANRNVEVAAEEKTSDYYSYSVNNKSSEKEGNKETNLNHIRGFKKLIYKNLYPGIDVQFEFHSQGGLKYTLTLHPGADASKVKMIYSNVNRISKDEKGNIHIPTLFGDILDHDPQTFYENNKNTTISSGFVITGKTVSFFLDNYDHTKMLVIDPWVQTPTIANSNAVWECQHDGAGNVYIIGGEVPMKLLKYNSAGLIQWTYATPYDTSNGDWLGTLATDLAGNSYVTCGAKAALTKVNTNAGVVYSVKGNQFTDEYWDIAFNCDQTKLIIGGTRLTGLPAVTGSGVIFDINTANGNVNSLKTVGQTTPGPTILGITPTYADEVRSITSSHNGRYYYLTLDTMGSIDQNFSACSSGAPIFALNSGYKLSYKCENYRPQSGNSGIRSIRANKFFVYTANGTNIQKRSLANGAILGTAAIPGGVNIVSYGQSQLGNSGIDIDTCGNVYVGSANAVIKYDANLNLISSVALPFSVYDVAVSIAGNVIVAGATGTDASTSRTGYVQSISSFAACNPLTLQCCDATICPAGPFCPSDPALNLTSSTAGGTWSGSGITNIGTGTFNPTTANTGTYTIVYSLGCGKDSMQITVKPPCAALSVCKQPNGDLTVSGGKGPYQWAARDSTTDCSTCFGGNCIPGFCNGTTTITWNNYSTSSTATPPGTFPIRVVDANLNTDVITTVSGMPSCSSVLNVTLIHTDNVCSSTCSGTATVNPPGGTAPITYAWSNTLTTSSITGLCAGTYTVTVKDATGASSISAVTILAPAAINASATPTPTGCGAATGSATVLPVSGGTGPPYTYSWSPTGGTGPTANNLSAGGYTCLVTDPSGCTKTASTSVNSTSGPTIQSSTSTPVKCNGANTGSGSCTVSGGTTPLTYSWTPTGGNAAAASGLAAGTYTVAVEDASGCRTTTAVVIIAPTAISATMSTLQASCGSSNGSATCIVNGGTPNYSYSWMPSGGNSATASNLKAGTYTCEVTDASACTQTFTTSVSNTVPAITISSQTNVSCNAGSNGSATVNATGGTTPITYSWNTVPSQTAATATNLSSGTYTVTVTDTKGCISTATVSITQPQAFVLTQSSTSTPCKGTTGTATITASGSAGPPYTYSWSAPGGTSSTLINLAAGSYTCTITDSKGCTSITTASVSNTGGGTVTMGVPTAIACHDGSNGSVTATATGGTINYTYSWSNGASSITSGSSQDKNLSAATYSVTMTDAAGCISISTVTLTNPAPITATAGPTTTIPFGTSINLNVSPAGALSYLWWPPYNLSDTTSDNPIFGPATTPGVYKYYVMVTEAGGCTVTDSLTITVNKELVCKCDNDSAFYLPTAFSPNGDNQNDELYMRITACGQNCIKSFQLFVFNRWGQMVFQTTQASQGWNGMFKSKLCDSGVFAYFLNIVLIDNTTINRKGNITLLR